MYKTKKDVDAHARSELSKILSPSERHLRSFSIAKLYYEINEFAIAEQYLCSYLSFREDNDQVHKLLGQCYRHLKKPDKALQSFQRSLQLNPKQSDILAEICQLFLEDKFYYLNTNKAKYWCELAESEKVQHEAVLSLQLKLMNKENLGTNQVEELIQKEIAARPNDVQLRVRLVRNYLEKNQILDAFKYVHQLEMSQKDEFVTSGEWYNVVWLVLNKYEQMPNTKKDWDFWLLLAICLERQVQISFFLTSNSTIVGGGVTETENLLFNLDQYLFKISQLSDEFCVQKELVELFLDHYRGQLLLHATVLIFKRLGRFQNKSQWKDSTRIVLPLMLLAYQIPASNKKQPWMKHCDKQIKQLITLWQREGSFRCAQVGRTLLSCVDDDGVDKENAHNINNLLGSQSSGLWQNNDELLNQVRQTCSDRQWRHNIFALLFCNSDMEQSSLFAMSQKLSEPIYEMPSNTDVVYYEDTAQYLHPQSLQHMVYLCLGNENLAYVKAKYFSGLNYSTQNLSFCGAESLNQLDVDSFLYAATIQAKKALEASSSALGKPKLLPFVNIHNMLCTKEQSQWWSAAYIVYKNLSSDNDLAELRANLQYGIEAVRGINGPKLDMAIVFKLGQIFVTRAQDIVKPVEKAYLEARAESIYKSGLNMMKMHNKGVLEPFRKYFKYVKSQTPAGDCALASPAEDAVSYLATRYLQKSEYEDLIEELSDIQLPFATYLQAEAYRKLYDASTMSKNSKRIYLNHAIVCLNQTLALLKSNTYANSDHLLHSIIRSEIKRLQQTSGRYLNESNTNFSLITGHNNSSAYEDEKTDLYIEHSIMPPVCMSNTTRSSRDTSSAIATLPSQNKEIKTFARQIVNTLTVFKDEVMNNFKSELQNITKEICILKDQILISEEAMRKINDRAGIIRSLTYLDLAVPVSSAAVNFNMQTGLRVVSNRPSNLLTPNVTNITSQSSSTTPPTPSQTTTVQIHKLNNQPVGKGPPFNVVITSSEPLPNTNTISLQSQQQTPLRVAIPSQHIKPSLVSQSQAPFSVELASFANKIVTSTTSSTTTTFGTSIATSTFSFKPQIAVTAAAAADQSGAQSTANDTLNRTSESSDDSRSITEEIEYDPRPDFKPIIPLADVIEVRTGEEDEDVMFCHRAKLFRHVDKEWKERGIGDIKILKNKEGTSRILMRRDQTHKICANHSITPELILAVPKNETKGFIWAANDFADEFLQLEKFFVRFKLPETAKQFQEAFKKAQKEAEDKQSTMPGKNAEKPKVASTPVTNTATPFALTKSITTNFATSTPAPKNDDISGPQTKPIFGQPTFVATTTTPSNTTPASKSLFSGLNLCTKISTSNDNTNKSTTVTTTSSSPFANFTFGKSTAPSSISTTLTATASSTVASKTGATITSTTSPFASIFSNLTSSPFINPTSNASTVSVIPTAVTEAATGNALNKSSTSDREDDYVPTAQFNPVIPLPDLVEVNTGEENEIVLFEHRAKLLRFDKEAGEWKERGLGNIKLLQDKDDFNKVRLVMRREQIHKLCCNQRIYKDTSFKYAKNSQTTLSWAGQDFSEYELITEMLTVRFKLPKTCKQFLEAIHNAQANMTSEVEKANSKISEKKNDVSESKLNKGFGDAFKPKVGSWSCNSCYISNDADRLYCVACDTSKDGTVPNKEITLNILAPSSNTKFSFGFSSTSSLATTSAAEQSQSSTVKPSLGFITPTTTSTSFSSESNEKMSSTKPSATGGFGDAFKCKAGSTKPLFSDLNLPTNMSSSNVNSTKSANFTFINWSMPSGTSSTSTTTISPTVASETGVAISSTFASISTQFEKNLEKIRKEAKVKQSALPGKNLEKSKVTSTRKSNTGRHSTLGKSRAINFVTSSPAPPKNVYSLGSETQKVFGKSIFGATATGPSITASTSKSLSSDLNLSTKTSSSNVNSAKPTAVTTATLADFISENVADPYGLFSTAKGSTDFRNLTTKSSSNASQSLDKTGVSGGFLFGSATSTTSAGGSIFGGPKDSKSTFGEKPAFFGGAAAALNSSLKDSSSSADTTTTKSIFGTNSTTSSSIFEGKPVFGSALPSFRSSAANDENKSIFGSSGDTSQSAGNGTGSSLFGSSINTSGFSNFIFGSNSTNLTQFGSLSKESNPVGTTFGDLSKTSTASADFSNLITKSNSNASRLNFGKPLNGLDSLDKNSSASKINELQKNIDGGCEGASTTSKGSTDFSNLTTKSSSNASQSLDKTGASGGLLFRSATSTASAGGSIFGPKDSKSSFSEKLAIFGEAVAALNSSSKDSSSSADTTTTKSIFGPKSITSSSICGRKPIFGSALQSFTSVANDINKSILVSFGNISQSAGTGTGSSLFGSSINTSGFSNSIFGSSSTNLPQFGSLTKESNPVGTKSNSNASRLNFGKPLNGLDSLDKNSSATKINELQKSIDGGGEGARDRNDENCNPHYVPVIELPNKVMFGTPQEDETKLFGERAFLFRWDVTTEQNKESGVGELKILLHPVKRNYRMVMRCVQIDKLVLNHGINADFHFDNMNNYPKGFVWESPNYAESNEGELEKLAVRFCKLEIAEAFSKKLRECIDNCKEREKGN